MKNLPKEELLNNKEKIIVQEIVKYMKLKPIKKLLDIALLTELEVSTTEASTNTALLSTAVSSALTSKQTAENLVASGFDLFFLVGA